MAEKSKRFDDLEISSTKKESEETYKTTDGVENIEYPNRAEYKEPNPSPKALRSSVEECITGDLNKNVVLFIGPRSVGKTVALIRLAHYLGNNRSIKIEPNSTFRKDEGYKKSVESFLNDLHNPDFHPDRTGKIDFLVLDVIKDADIYCQFLEAPGEAYFDPDNIHNQSFPPYLDTILSENTNKIFVFFFEENMLSDSDPIAYSKRIASLVGYMNRKKDDIIIVFNKSDKKRALFKDNKPNTKAFKELIYKNQKYNTFISTISQAGVPVKFVVFSSGTFKKLPNSDKQRWVHSSESNPETLWRTIDACFKSWSWM
jgi:GTPase SAR1 family protein